MHIYGEGLGGNTGQLDEDSTVRDTGQLIGKGDTSLVSKKKGSRLPGRDLLYSPLLQDTVGLS